MKNKTTTAIQKSRGKAVEELAEQLSRMIYHQRMDSLGKGFVADEVKNKIKDHITTSQKDILSALVDDMEGLKKDLLVKTVSGDNITILTDDVGFNEGISKAQDIIRKAREV